MIPFNKPYIAGNELEYIRQAVDNGKITGNGYFTAQCHAFFEKKYGFKKVLLTSSCTDALEMAAILAEIAPGDEVIVPSFAFVSTANAFVLRGARILFADSNQMEPNIDITQLERLITPKTKAIVVLHYAGMACNMDAVMRLANEHHLLVIEDAAQAINGYYKDRPLGSIGHFAAFSFHETKNIMSGEGGLLVINDPRFHERADLVWEKGTNRVAFSRGLADKYQWLDIGSSFLPSEITAAYLFAQLEHLDNIQQKRLNIWNSYLNNLVSLQNRSLLRLPIIPEGASNNGHMFYLLCEDALERAALIAHLKNRAVMAVSHYQSLHASPFYHNKHSGGELFYADRYSNSLLRLPLYNSMTADETTIVSDAVLSFF